MFPSLSQLNGANAELANAIHSPQFSLGQPGHANMPYIFFSQFCGAVLFAFFIVCAMSTLPHHISDVLSMSSHGEMSWIDAGRIVTGVHDFHPRWDHALLFDHPRDSIGGVRFVSIMNSEVALATQILGSEPRPTGIRRGFMDLAPKATKKSVIKHNDYVQTDKGFCKFSSI
jgi:hypothetical protein